MFKFPFPVLRYPYYTGLYYYIIRLYLSVVNVLGPNVNIFLPLFNNIFSGKQKFSVSTYFKKDSEANVRVFPISAYSE